jgi:hypothetical protein
MAKFQSQNSAKFSPDDPSVSGNENEPSGHAYLWQSSEDEESSFLGLIDRVGCYDSGELKHLGQGSSMMHVSSRAMSIYSIILYRMKLTCTQILIQFEIRYHSFRLSNMFPYIPKVPQTTSTLSKAEKGNFGIFEVRLQWNWNRNA